MIYKVLTIISVLFLTACSSTPPAIYNTKSSSSEPISRIYYANYDYTWMMALKELQRFNLKITNKASGTIVTDDMNGFSSGYVRSQFRYYFDVKVTALAPEKGIPQTQVSITKFIYKDRGMFPEKPIKSNAVDETVILYRIKRLLEIERIKLERTRDQSTTVR